MTNCHKSFNVPLMIFAAKTFLMVQSSPVKFVFTRLQSSTFFCCTSRWGWLGESHLSKINKEQWMIKNKEQLQEKKQHVLNSFNNSICFVMKVWFTYHIYKINFALVSYFLKSNSLTKGYSEYQTSKVHTTTSPFHFFQQLLIKCGFSTFIN